MSGEISVSKTLLEWTPNEGPNKELLYVDGQELKIWKPADGGLKRFVLWITGSFDRESIAQAISRGLENPEIDKLNDVVQKVEVLKNKYNTTEGDSWFFGLFTKGKEGQVYVLEELLKKLKAKNVQQENASPKSDEVSQNTPERLSGSSSDEKKISALNSLYEIRKPIWNGNHGFYNWDVVRNNDFELSVFKKGIPFFGQNDNSIAVQTYWDERAAKLVECHKEYKGMIPNDLISKEDRKALDAKFEEILPDLLNDGDEKRITNLVAKELEGPVNDLFDKKLKEFQNKYGKNLRLETVQQNLKSDIVRLINGASLETIYSEWEKTAQNECVENLFQVYKSKYSELDLSLIENSLDRYSDYFVKFGDAENRIKENWNGLVDSVAEKRNKDIWVKELFPKYSAQYPHLKLKVDDFPDVDFKNVKEAKFKTAVDDWMKKKHIEAIGLGQAIQDQMKAPYQEFWKVLSVSTGTTPAHLLALDANELDTLHRESLLRAASDKFVSEYGLAIAIHPDVSGINSFEGMGYAVNQSILEALFMKHSGEIDEKVGRKKMTDSNPEERRMIFDRAIEEMAEKNKLDPAKVKSGEVRLTGYLEKDMSYYISKAVIMEHGTFLEKAQCLVAG